MAAMAQPVQHLGKFEFHRPEIEGAIERVPLARRSAVGGYYLLNNVSPYAPDPEFPHEGSYKKIYFCFARDIATGRYTIHLALTAADERNDALIMMRQEIRAYELLHGVPGVLAPRFCQKGDQPFMIADIFNGGDLFDWTCEQTDQIRSKKNEIRALSADATGVYRGTIDALRQQINRMVQTNDQVAYQLARATLDCHARGVIIRDLKPENVGLTIEPNGSIRTHLFDFGLCLIVSEATAADAHTTRGSPAYMPMEHIEAEMIHGKRIPITPAYDLYALGVTFFALSNGYLPAEIEPMDLSKGKHIKQGLKTALGDKAFAPLLAKANEIRQTLRLMTFKEAAKEASMQLGYCCLPAEFDGLLLQMRGWFVKLDNQRADDWRGTYDNVMDDLLNAPLDKKPPLHSCIIRMEKLFHATHGFEVPAAVGLLPLTGTEAPVLPRPKWLTDSARA
jgi:serine/threonine protein kinase